MSFPKGLVNHNEEFIRQLDYMVDHLWGIFFIYNNLNLFNVTNG